MAPVSRPDVSSSVPSALDLSTIDCTWSAVKALVTSSRGSTPSNRTMQLAIQLSAAMMGFRIRAIATSGGARQHRGPIGVRDRGVLGHHLADDDVQRHDDRQRDDQRDHVRGGLEEAQGSP